MKFRAYIKAGDKRYAIDIELTLEPAENEIVTGSDGRRYRVTHPRTTAPLDAPPGYDGAFAAELVE